MKLSLIKELSYKIINLITFGRGIKKEIGNTRLRLPARYFRYFPNDYEKENLKIIDEYIQEGMVVVDVGAHIGLLSAVIAKKLKASGNVYSFEPTPSTFLVLRNTIKINGLENSIRPVQAALSNKSGKTIFYISNNTVDNSNSLVNNRRSDRKEEAVDVVLYSLDDFLKQENVRRLDFIKIDAEGAELQVLRGAQQSIANYHPLIILAIHPQSIKNFGDSLEEIWDFIHSNKYNAHLEGRIIKKEDFISRKDLFDVFLRK